jgi:hypothetical protein
MAQYKEEKLEFFLQLIEWDFHLLLLSIALGRSDFGKVLKTFAGTTITFPTENELRTTLRKVKNYKKSFNKILKQHGKNINLGHLAQLGLVLNHKDVQKAVKAKLTHAVIQEYIKSTFEDDSFKLTMDEIKNISTGDKLEWYKLNLQELAIRNNIFKTITKSLK